ncbi:MAG: DUF262 domain-containing protein [Enterococcus sp.]|nr:DUF262 domain-containing protein [Enterococcus sp.]
MKLSHQRLGAREFMQKLGQGSIALPSLQREYVWTDKQVNSFLLSIYKERPLGNQFHLWIPAGIEANEVSEHSRTIASVRSSRDKKSNVEYLIIDGQQRLTSLQKIYSGQLNVYFNPMQGSFHMTKKSKYVSVRNLWLWQGDVEEFTNQEYGTPLKEGKEKDLILDSIQQLMDNIQGLTFDCTILDGHSSSDIIEIFTLLNSAGKNVNSKESIIIPLLIQAIPGMRLRITKFIENKIESKYGKNFQNIIDVNFVAMTIIYQIFGYTQNINFYKSKDLQTGDGAKLLNDAFEKVTTGISLTLDLLDESLGINTGSMISSSFTIQVLALAFGNKQNNTIHKISGKDHNAALLYFLVANSKSRYSKSDNNRPRNNDIIIAKSNDAFNKLSETMINEYRGKKDHSWFKSDDLVQVDYKSGKKNPIITLLGIALRHRGAIGFADGFKKIDFSNCDRHHIFPSSKVKDHSVCDNIGNLTFIHSDINRKDFKDQLPDLYLHNIGVLKECSEDVIEDQLDKHFISINDINLSGHSLTGNKELLDSKFAAFVNHRRNLISNYFNTFLNSYVM